MAYDNLGPIIAGDGMRFLDTPSMLATRARCIYFGKLIREQPKWLQDNSDNVRLLTVAEQAALAPRPESAVAAASPPVSAPTLLSDERSDSAAASLLPRPEHRPLEDKQSVAALLPTVAHSSSTIHN